LTPQLVQRPADVDERIEDLVEHVLEPGTVVFVGVTPVHEGGVVVGEDRPQSRADGWEL